MKAYVIEKFTNNITGLALNYQDNCLALAGTYDEKNICILLILQLVKKNILIFSSKLHLNLQFPQQIFCLQEQIEFNWRGFKKWKLE